MHKTAHVVTYEDVKRVLLEALLKIACTIRAIQGRCPFIDSYCYDQVTKASDALSYALDARDYLNIAISRLRKKLDELGEV